MALNSTDFYNQLQQQFLLPIIRMNAPDICLKLCERLAHNGFGILEITLTTPNALNLISDLSAQNTCIGAGTVLTVQEAREVKAAGAQFLVSPGFSPELAQWVLKENMPWFPGVYTPSEVMQALAFGQHYLKLFPAMPAGLTYLKNLQGPFPQIKWLPTGGIPFDKIKDYHAAGAFAVGQGTRLVNREDLQQENWTAIDQQLQTIQSQIQNMNLRKPLEQG